MKYLYIFLLCLIFLSGCNSSGDSLKDSTTDSKKSSTTFAPTKSKYSLEKKLLPPKFIVTNFDMGYNEERKELSYFMDYEFDTEIYNMLAEEKQKLYFSLEYPEHVQKYFENISSDFIMAEKPKNHKNIYQAEFKTKTDLKKEDVQKIKESLSGYNLLIADKDKDIVARFNDLYGFNGYKPGVSGSTHIDETKE
ncbi:hypothetical protein CEW92_10500 [Bacillaceae bacterium SAS-127]|nr:hypothetical protein CEW92_10500 [Bacillaceae bacterium SAS-127]